MMRAVRGSILVYVPTRVRWASSAPQNAAAEFEGVVDGLHSWSVLGEVIVTEVRLLRTGRDDQAVVLGEWCGRGCSKVTVRADRAMEVTSPTRMAAFR